MVNWHCAAGICTSDSRKLRNIEKYQEFQNVKFVPLPLKKREKKNSFVDTLDVETESARNRTGKQILREEVIVVYDRRLTILYRGERAGYPDNIVTDHSVCKQ